jgi:hypothetical protein
LPGTAALLPTGAALAVDSQATTLWLDGESLMLTPLPSARAGYSVTVLEDGSALVAGGGDASLVLYDPVIGPRSLVGPFSGREHSATRLGDGSVLLAGGGETGGASVHASIFLHSPLGPFSNLSTLTFDSSMVPLMPRRPDRMRVAAGQLELTAAAPSGDGQPAEFALVAALDLNDVTLSLVAATDGGAALIVGWQSNARYAFVSLTRGQQVTLSTVSAGAVAIVCRGETLTADDLPDTSANSLAPITVDWRGGHFAVFTPARRLLTCIPGDKLGRGAAGVGALTGRALFDDLTLTR